MKFCPNCKSLANDSDEFCDVCGTKLEMIISTIKSDEKKIENADFTEPFDTCELSSIINSDTSSNKKDNNISRSNIDENEFNRNTRINIVIISVALALIIITLLCTIATAYFVVRLNKDNKKDEKVMKIEDNMAAIIDLDNSIINDENFITQNDDVAIVPDKYISYYNDRFSFFVNIPKVFDEINYSGNGDGVSCYSNEDDAYLDVYGYNNIFDVTAKEEYEQRLKEIDNISYNVQKENWYTLCYSNENYEYYIYCKIGNCANVLSLKYPKNKSQYYSKLIDEIYRSFECGDISSCH